MDVAIHPAVLWDYIGTLLLMSGWVRAKADENDAGEGPRENLTTVSVIACHS